MKIALVCPYDLGAPGGVQDQVIQLSKWLDVAGHEAVVVGPGTEGPPGSVLLGPTRTVQANASSTPISLNPRSLSLLATAVDDAEVVHIHEPLMPLVSLSASRIAHIPSVGTFHADPPSWARRGYAALSPFLAKALARIDVVTTVSPVSRSAIEPFTTARVIPNGIETDDYGGVAAVPGRVAFLGRDDPRKGLDVLLEAWPTISRAHRSAALHIMGAERGSPPSGVTYLGRVSGGQKFAELSEAQVFVAPNLGGESFGIIVAEAMASGCAVVASGIPAFLHVLGDTGMIVAPRDSEALATAVTDLLTNDVRRDELAQAAATRVQRFDGGHVSASYIAAYEDAIARHRAK